jgi:uncharacterized delta-60 repeat protein
VRGPSVVRGSRRSRGQEGGDECHEGDSGITAALHRFALARFDARGNLDRTFGGDGRVMTRFRSASAEDVAIASDGRIVVAGRACCGKDSTSLFALALYDRDGSLDLSFGGDGKVKTAFRFGSAGASGVALQADGKIVACGSASFGHAVLFALARYVT